MAHQKQAFTRKAAILLILCALFALASFSLLTRRDPATTEVAQSPTPTQSKVATDFPSDPLATSPSATPRAKLPANAYLTVPFTSQAPFAIWDALHEDACEEASLLMVKHFREGTTFSKNSIDQEIIDLVRFDAERGRGPSITLQELNDLARTYLGMAGGRIVKNPTIEDIKYEIQAGRPVIVGAAGRILPNPNFRNGGPVYHMYVITGYDQNGFITNDPGTTQGKDFRYSYTAVLDSLRNWDPIDISNGAREYLVFD